MSFMLKHVQGVDIYLIISLFIFLFFFIGVTIYLVKGNKKHFEEMSKVPLKD